MGDCRHILEDLPENTVDLIITSPPYADQRKETYGGIRPDEYVDWFLPITEQFNKEKKFSMYQEAVMVPMGNWAKSRLRNLSITDKRRDNSKVASRMGRPSIGIEIYPDYYQQLREKVDLLDMQLLDEPEGCYGSKSA